MAPEQQHHNPVIYRGAHECPGTKNGLSRVDRLFPWWDSSVKTWYDLMDAGI
jgi:hypothetical protein